MKQRIALVLFVSGFSTIVVIHLTYAILTFNGYVPWDYFIGGKIDSVYYIAWLLFLLGSTFFVFEIIDSLKIGKVK